MISKFERKTYIRLALKFNRIRLTLSKEIRHRLGQDDGRVKNHYYYNLKK